MTTNNRLQEVTSLLGSDYKTWKTAEKDKNTQKDKFFELATEALEQETLATVALEIEADSYESAEELAHSQYPRYRVIKVVKGDDNLWVITMEEDPALKPFVYVNRDDKMVYQRQVVEGSPMLDDERLQEEAPELWEEITYVPEPERKLKSFDQLSAEQLAAVQPFLYSAKPSVKLAAPRKAKPEELEDEVQ
jgi:hypothetical protein